jgi:acyl CoA:acetate/3-ketoacid CoA transferase beta subunit
MRIAEKGNRCKRLLCILGSRSFKHVLFNSLIFMEQTNRKGKAKMKKQNKTKQKQKKEEKKIVR